MKSISNFLGFTNPLESKMRTFLIVLAITNLNQWVEILPNIIHKLTSFFQLHVVVALFEMLYSIASHFCWIFPLFAFDFLNLGIIYCTICAFSFIEIVHIYMHVNFNFLQLMSSVRFMWISLWKKFIFIRFLFFHHYFTIF
jgi:hypothetical protein